MKRSFIPVLLIPAAIFAQPPDEERRAKDLLQSPRLIEKAWGAHLAGGLRTAELNGLLTEELERAQSYRGAAFASEEHAYVLALFDALIESGAAVAAERLLPFAGNSRDEVLILLARDPADAIEDALLAMRGEQLNQAQWLTVNNLLYGMRSARFFARTLEELRIVHRFQVVDAAGGGFGGGVGGGGNGDGAVYLPKGFPPTGIYQLVAFPVRGDVLVARGPRDVFYRRTVVPTNQQAGWGVQVQTSDRQEERLEYLAGLVRVSMNEAGEIFHPSSSIVWRDADQFEQEANRRLGEQAARIASFVAAAEKAGFTGLAGMKLTIVPEMEDHRAAVKAPLRELKPLELAAP